MRAWLKKFNIGFWLLSLVLAVMFWLYVSIVQDDEIDMPLALRQPTFEGQEALLDEREILVTDGADIELQIRLHGKRSDLALCTRDTVRAVASLDAIDEAGVHSVYCSILLPDEVEERVRVVWRSMVYIPITTDIIKNDVFEVLAERGGVKVADGYKLDDVWTDPERVRVRGPSEQLRKIERAYVAPVRTDADRTVSFLLDVILEDDAGNRITDGLTCDPSSVEVTVAVSRIKEVELRVGFDYGGGVQEGNAAYTVEPGTIWLTGDPSVLDVLNFIELGSIDLANATDGQKFSFDIKLPNGVTSDAKLDAEVTVRLTGLVTKKFEAANITLAGASPPEGYEVVPLTQSLMLTLRGPQAAMDHLDEYVIRVVADLTGKPLAIGKQDWLAAVYVDGSPEIGAVGEVKVTFDVVESAPPDTIP